MSQTGWAERDAARPPGGFQYTVSRFSSSITFILGALAVLALRPVELTDTRDVLVSTLALGACWLVGLIATKILATVIRTTVEVDRVVTWSTALVVGLLLSSTGIAADLSREVDDYVADVPGYTLTSSSEKKAELVASTGASHSEMFSDVGVWTFLHDLKTAGTLSVFLVTDGEDAEDLGAKVLFSRALAGPSDAVRRDRLAGQSILVSHSGGEVHVGWLDGSALVVVSGRSRDLITPVAASLLKKG